MIGGCLRIAQAAGVGTGVLVATLLMILVHHRIDPEGIARDWAFGALPPDTLALSLESILPLASDAR